METTVVVCVPESSRGGKCLEPASNVSPRLGTIEQECVLVDQPAPAPSGGPQTVVDAVVQEDAGRSGECLVDEGRELVGWVEAV